MKKNLILFILILSCWTAYADSDSPEKIETLCTKVPLKNKEGYFVLSDESMWKVIGFSKRWRSLSEWWNNVSLAPENYLCNPDDWYLGSEIEVYSKLLNVEVDEDNASNKKTLKQCTHLLINKHTQQVLFAIAFKPAEGLLQLFRDARHEGYEEGYSRGRLQGYQNSQEIYNSGYSEGFREGSKVGYREGLKDR